MIISNKGLALEVMSLARVGWQAAKKIVKLSTLQPDTYRTISKRRMSQQEALRIVEAAKTRIALVDEGS